MTEDELYSAIEAAIIRWNLDGTKTAGELTREIMLIIKLPTEEEIAENAYIWCQVPDENNRINSGDDYDQHELPAFIAGAQWVVNLIKQQENEKNN